ncbi:Hypothetical predicted protein [Paramuricea clavata]|uniref:Uncharacterized protein n=1 Tax=Paramuricea clavata TaxID=317549 RepID=A0A6S7HTL2_PARCT|nr:Hypothetical predicted protein [Paramuricea clavata]
MEIVRSIVMSVVFVWMFNFVEITNVVKALPMMNVAFVWRMLSLDVKSFPVPTKSTKNVQLK